MDLAVHLANLTLPGAARARGAGDFVVSSTWQGISSGLLAGAAGASVRAVITQM